jgi:hypothetical protein
MAETVAGTPRSELRANARMGSVVHRNAAGREIDHRKQNTCAKCNPFPVRFPDRALLTLLSPSPNCGADQYVEPTALTLIDMARSNDRQTSALAQQVIERIQARSVFADFIWKQPQQCRVQWIFRVEAAQASAIVDILKSKGATPA